MSCNICYFCRKHPKLGVCLRSIRISLVSLKRTRKGWVRV